MFFGLGGAVEGGVHAWNVSKLLFTLGECCRAKKKTNGKKQERVGERQSEGGQNAHNRLDVDHINALERWVWCK